MEEYELSKHDTELLIAAPANTVFFEATVPAAGLDAKTSANWIIGELTANLNRSGINIENSPVTPEMLGGLIRRIKDGTISGKIAKEVFEAMWNGEGDADRIIEAKGLKQVTDSGLIEKLVDQVIAANPAQAEQYRQGKDKVIAFLVGQVMKQSGGKFNPQQVNELLRQKLSP